MEHTNEVTTPHTLDLRNIGPESWLNAPYKTVQLIIPKGLNVQYRVLELSPIEFYKQQFSDIVGKAPNVNETKLYLLSYIVVYGKNYKQEVLKSRICTSLESINNFETALRAADLIQGYWPDLIINPNIKLEHTDCLTFQFILKDEEKDEVYHRNFKR